MGLIGTNYDFYQILTTQNKKKKTRVNTVTVVLCKEIKEYLFIKKDEDVPPV